MNQTWALVLMLLLGPRPAPTSIYSFGDSITKGFGVKTADLSYWTLLISRLGIATVQAKNFGVPGDRAGDMSLRLISVYSPTDAANPIVTTMIGANDTFRGRAGITTFTQFQMATHTWAALSNAHKILAREANSHWQTDATFAGAMTSSNPGDTLSARAAVSASGVLYAWYAVPNDGPTGTASFPTGAFSCTVDGRPAVDTITGASNLSTIFHYPFRNPHGGVAVARFVATPGQHVVNVSVRSGTVTVLGFGLPPGNGAGGPSAPVVYMGGVPPQMNNANADDVALYNAASMSVWRTLVADRLNVFFVDVHAKLDPDLDFTATTREGCVGSTQPGLHPGTCGMRHLAEVFESVIESKQDAASTLPVESH